MTNNSKSLENILNVAREASKLGAEVQKSYFGRVGLVQEKPDSSVVSEADRESERVIRQHLLSKLPEYSFWGEEGGLQVAQDSEGTWHVDPLDGTTNYVHGFPYFSTSIALEVKGEIVVSAVDAPMLGLSFWATRGGGAYMNSQKLKVGNRTALSDCLLATGFSSEKKYDRQLELFAQFLGKARGIRRAGAAVLDLCFTASGVFDGFWEQELKPWDMASGSLLIEEAGGKVTSITGQKWTTASSSIVAGSAKIHELMSELIVNKLTV